MAALVAKWESITRVRARVEMMLVAPLEGQWIIHLSSCDVCQVPRADGCHCHWWGGSLFSGCCHFSLGDSCFLSVTPTQSLPSKFVWKPPWRKPGGYCFFLNNSANYFSYPFYLLLDTRCLHRWRWLLVYGCTATELSQFFWKVQLTVWSSTPFLWRHY